MAKIIRPTYPLEFSIGLLLLIFVLSGFLSFEIFAVQWHEIVEGGSSALGMALAGIAVVIMSLILWEEFLFPVRIKPAGDEIVFRNHFTKLRTQVLIYSIIPVIVCVVYLNYNVSYIPFLIWSGICIIAPIGRLFSGIRNYNDFLKISNDKIEYKNNKKEGILLVTEIQKIMLMKDEANVLHRINVLMTDKSEFDIDLDEMELEAYLQVIEQFITSHYAKLLNR